MIDSIIPYKQVICFTSIDDREKVLLTCIIVVKYLVFPCSISCKYLETLFKHIIHHCRIKESSNQI